jgi:hypothetical protein
MTEKVLPVESLAVTRQVRRVTEKVELEQDNTVLSLLSLVPSYMDIVQDLRYPCS